MQSQTRPRLFMSEESKQKWLTVRAKLTFLCTQYLVLPLEEIMCTVEGHDDEIKTVSSIWQYKSYQCLQPKLDWFYCMACKPSVRVLKSRDIQLWKRGVNPWLLMRNSLGLICDYTFQLLLFRDSFDFLKLRACVYTCRGQRLILGVLIYFLNCLPIYTQHRSEPPCLKILCAGA